MLVVLINSTSSFLVYWLGVANVLGYRVVSTPIVHFNNVWQWSKKFFIKIWVSRCPISIKTYCHSFVFVIYEYAYWLLTCARLKASVQLTILTRISPTAFWDIMSALNESGKKYGQWLNCIYKLNKHIHTSKKKQMK